MKKLLVLISLLVAMLVPPSVLAQEKESVDPGIEDGSAVRELKKARAAWRGLGIRDYRMTVRRGCFCIGPFQNRITVRDGKPAGLSGGLWYGPRTVPGMFKIIDEAIVRRVADIDVRYDNRLGYPAEVSIDYIALAVDDEITYRITSFRRLN